MPSIAPHSSDRCVPLATLSAALDEIYFLRSALAYESRVVEVALSYKSLPKRVRERLEGVRDRLAAAARGERSQHVQGTRTAKLCLRLVGASDTLTRSQWESQRGIGDA